MVTQVEEDVKQERRVVRLAVFCAALTGLLANRNLTAPDAVRMALAVVDEAGREWTW